MSKEPNPDSKRYATHLPVLAALSWVIPLRSILEFGAGMHSTGVFLSLASVKQLISVETNAEWQKKVALAFPDERLQLRHSRPPASTLGCVDLVFIDDGQPDDLGERVKTIEWVLGQPHPPVVIHDSEVPAYRAAINELSKDHYTFDREQPWTELVR